jgi:hypothetical protein
MRLGNEVLVDVTVAPEGDPPEPRPEETVLLTCEIGEIEVSLWAVPRIPRPDGVRQMNLQFRQEDLGGAVPIAGGLVRW